MNINTHYIAQLVAKSFLVILTTTVIIYIFDDVLLKDNFEVSSSIYEVAGIGFLLFGFLSGYFLFEFRNKTPKNGLIQNKLLLLIFTVLGFAYVSGIETVSEIASYVLDFVCLGTFYFVAIRILKMSSSIESSIQENTVPLKYQIKKIVVISIVLASVLVFLSYVNDLSLLDGDDLVKEIWNNEDLSKNYIAPSTDEEIEKCLSEIECLVPMYLSAQFVQKNLISSYGSNGISEDTEKYSDAKLTYETELEKLTHGEAKLLEEQVVFSRALLTEYVKVLVRPYMQELKAAFQLYTDNRDMSAYDKNLFVSKHKYDGVMFGLESYDSAYFSSSFSPFGIYEHFLGGKDLLIIFHNKPDRLFRVWMKQQSNGSSTEWFPMTIYDTGIPREEVEQLYWQYKKVDEGAQEIIELYSELGVDVFETLEYMDAIALTEQERGPIIADDMTAEELHTSPFISHIRVALDNYVKGSVDGLEETSIDTIQDGCGLSTFDQTYFKSPFILFDAEDGEFGGVNIDIVFTEKPDRIFSAWVYQYGTGEFVLRGFCEVGPSDEKQADFDAMMKEIISNGDYYKAL